VEERHSEATIGRGYYWFLVEPNLAACRIVGSSGKIPHFAEKRLTTRDGLNFALAVTDPKREIGILVYEQAAASAADPPAALPDAQERVTRAAAITSNATRLTIATHTGVVDAAHLVLDILAEYGVAPDRWIFVHAQNEPEPARILEVAERGAWVELDCIQDDTVEQHLQLFLGLIDAGHASQLLLSHDGGWYDVGREPYEKRPFTALSDRFLPEARRRGVSDRLLTQVRVANPARAYACRP